MSKRAKPKLKPRPRATYNGLKRWYVWSNNRRVVVWSETSQGAKDKASSKGLVVKRVGPAPGL